MRTSRAGFHGRPVALPATTPVLAWDARRGAFVWPARDVAAEAAAGAVAAGAVQVLDGPCAALARRLARRIRQLAGLRP